MQNVFRPNAGEDVGSLWRLKMLHYAVVFLIIALIAGGFGFWGVESTATMIAKVLFFLFLVMFVASLLMGRRSTSV